MKILSIQPTPQNANRATRLELRRYKLIDKKQGGKAWEMIGTGFEIDACACEVNAKSNM